MFVAHGPPAAMALGSRVKTAPTKKSKPPALAGRRADDGAPVGVFFVKQPEPLRAILDELRGLIAQAAPDATAVLKWGMPFFTRGGETMCALAAFKSHVNLILPGPPGPTPTRTAGSRATARPTAPETALAGGPSARDRPRLAENRGGARQGVRRAAA